MKILFLDIDGVLNTMEFISNNNVEPLFKDETTNYYFKMIDPNLINKLDKIIKETDCKIILSSTWRNVWEITQTIFQYYHIPIFDKTPIINDYWSVRGNEILKWLKDNEDLLKMSYYDFKSYVILDDDTDMLYWQKDNFIHVNNEIGLSDKDVEKAIEILNWSNN